MQKIMNRVLDKAELKRYIVGKCKWKNGDIKSMKLPKFKDYKENKMFLWKTKKEYSEECKQLKQMIREVSQDRDNKEKDVFEMQAKLERQRRESNITLANYQDLVQELEATLKRTKDHSTIKELKSEYKQLEKKYADAKANFQDLRLRYLEFETKFKISEMKYAAQGQYIDQLKQDNENHSPTGLLMFAESVVSMVKELKNCDTPVIKIEKGNDKDK